MNELEMEIGRTLGASAFYVYQTIKHNPKLSAREVEMETGLSEVCVRTALVNLKETNILVANQRIVPGKNGKKAAEYVPNNAKETWKLH